MAAFTRNVTGGYLVLTVPEIIIALVLAWLFMRPTPPPIAAAQPVPGDNAGNGVAGNVTSLFGRAS